MQNILNSWNTNDSEQKTGSDKTKIIDKAIINLFSMTKDIRQ